VNLGFLKQACYHIQMIPVTAHFGADDSP